MEINETTKSEDNSEELTWLKNLQRNSWEPEVIISGLSLAFIFAFPAQIYDFAVKLTQDYGLEFIGAYLVLLYLSIIVSVFKIFFSVHLVLRFTWAGLLGLSYAFPDGVINEKLFKNSRDFQYKKPQEMVLKLEKICSMAFSFPMMMGMIFIVFTLYLGLLLFLYRYFDLNFFMIYLFFLASLVGFGLLSAFSKKNKFKSSLNASIFSTVQAIYQSNLGKWSISAYSIFIMGLTAPLIKSDSKGFFNFANYANLDQDLLEWPDNSMYFEDQKDPQKRFPRAMMPSAYISGDFTSISIAYYDEDNKNFGKIKEGIHTLPDSLAWPSLENQQDLYKIFLNDSLVSNKITEWKKVSYGKTDQRAYLVVLDIKGLKPGAHEIRIEKLTLFGALGFSEPEIKHRKNWAKFSFIKVTS